MTSNLCKNCRHKKSLHIKGYYNGKKNISYKCYVRVCPCKKFEGVEDKNIQSQADVNMHAEKSEEEMVKHSLDARKGCGKNISFDGEDPITCGEFDLCPECQKENPFEGLAENFNYEFANEIIEGTKTQSGIFDVTDLEKQIRKENVKHVDIRERILQVHVLGRIKKERLRLKAEVEKVIDDLKMLYRNNTEGLLFLKELKKRLGI